MNTATGIEPFHIRGFNGLWSRGLIDNVPPDHLQQCSDCVFPGRGEVMTRPGLNRSQTLSNGVRQFFQAAIGGGLQLLYIDGNIKLYNEAGVLLRAFGGGVDGFTAINLAGRTYISPTWQGGAGVGENTWYYDGANFRRAAAGSMPSPPAGVTLLQVNPGVVDVGDHNVAVLFESPTGFLTQPGGFSTIISTGGKDIEVSSIPIDGTGLAVARVLIMSKSNGTEMFFTGIRIPNNSTTTATINLSDDDLVLSADYLYDIVSPSLPSCAALRYYKGRLVLAGPVTAPDEVWFSNVNDFETIDSVNGVILPPTERDGNTIRTCFELRDVLYLSKLTGTFSTQDNGDVPANWTISIVDYGYGCYDTGLSSFTAAFSGRDVLDAVLIAHPEGLFLFDGVFRERPLTYKIQDIWRSLDLSTFYLLRIAHDIWTKQVYILTPWQVSPPGLLLVMDYNEGLSYDTVKWSVWHPLPNQNGTGSPGLITCIGMGLLPIDGVYTLRLSGYAKTYIYGLDTTGTIRTDDSTTYNSVIMTGQLRPHPGHISSFVSIVSRIINPSATHGLLLVGSSTNNTVASYPIPAIADNRTWTRQINITSDCLILQVQCLGSGFYFRLTGFDIYARPMYIGRPDLNP